MSWYFLGGFSAYLGPVGPAVEPVRVLGQPRVVGRCVDREVQAHVHVVLGRRGAERADVVDRPQLRVHGVVAALGEPTAYGEPGSSGPATSVLLRPLRFVVPIGWIGVR